MNTLRLTTNKKDLETAKNLLKKGEIIAVPTDTVYGLIALSSNANARDKVYELKNRNKEKKLILLCSNSEMVKRLATEFTENAKNLSDKFWPGPLTLILKVNNESVGFRVPKHDAVIKLISSLNEPVISTSANLTNEESATNYETVKKYFDGKVSAIIDGGETSLKVASTILDATASPHKILREGAIAAAQLLPSA